MLKQIPGYEGYSASVDGRIFSHKSGRFLAPTRNQKGHLLVQLHKEGAETWAPASAQQDERGAVSDNTVIEVGRTYDIHPDSALPFARDILARAAQQVQAEGASPAAQGKEAHVVPEGYALVPIKATPEIIGAFRQKYSAVASFDEAAFREDYAMLLAAAMRTGKEGTANA